MSTPGKDPAEVMREMRTGWLTRVPERGSYARDDEVTAVVMDWPLDEQIVTVLSSSIGDASLYTTSTFGIIGGIDHESVRKAAIAFVACAQRFLNITTPTTTFPYPDGQTLRFYMVTPSGVRTVSFPLRDIEQSDSAAGTLFDHGQHVVTELRLITSDENEEDAGSPKKEWLGESGYCNCLLVAMSRIPIRSVELASDQPPPNLETLTSSRPTTNAWIRAQEFDFSALDSGVIIEHLAKLGGVRKSLFGYQPGRILVHDCVEDDGPVVERKFALRLARAKGALRLTVTLEAT